MSRGDVAPDLHLCALGSRLLSIPEESLGYVGLDVSFTTSVAYERWNLLDDECHIPAFECQRRMTGLQAPSVDKCAPARFLAPCFRLVF